MSDDETPGNVFSLPRIGSMQPPAAPAVPVLAPAGSGADSDADAVRISPFDLSPAPVAPAAPGLVPATFRSEPADAGPPRTGALSMAAVLAIALAAFEGIRTWVQESGPRRMEAAAHKRKLELMAAKADSDAARYGARTDAERARMQQRGGRGVQSSHEYGGKALGRGSGGSGRRGGPQGSGGSGKGSSGPHKGSGGSGSKGSNSQASKGSKGPKPPKGSSRSDTTGVRKPKKSSGGGQGPGGGSPSGKGGGKGQDGKRPGGKNSSGKDKTSSGSSGASSSGTGKGGGGRKGKNGRTTLPQAVQNAIEERWNKRKPSSPFITKDNKPKEKSPKNGDKTRDDAGSAGTEPKSSKKDDTKQPGPGPINLTKPNTKGKKHAPGDADRTTFWAAVGDTARNRWKNRDRTPPYTKTPPKTPKPDSPTASKPGSGPAGSDASSKTKPRRGEKKDGTDNRARDEDSMWDRFRDRLRKTGPSSSGGFDGSDASYSARTSPFDTEPDPGPGPLKVPMERADAGPGSQAKRWEPASIGAAQRSLPRTGPAALPRAPQRPAGARPGTTRRKDPIPMPATPARPAPGGLAAQHATEITLDDSLKALQQLTTEGMDTHDDCDELARQARRLLGVIDDMKHDLADAHNADGPRTRAALHTLLEAVSALMREADRMAKDALDAAELAEAEETAMNRDYRPYADATADAGLVAPSSRLHLEN